MSDIAKQIKKWKKKIGHANRDIEIARVNIRALQVECEHKNADGSSAITRGSACGETYHSCDICGKET